MRTWFLVIATAACDPAVPFDSPDARQPLDDAFYVPDGGTFDTRPTSAVVVGAHQVAWARGGQACPIARGGGPCPDPAPGVVTAPLATGAPIVRVQTLEGIAALAGDDSALFYLNRDLGTKVFLERLRPGVPADFLWSTATSFVIGPVVDATNVYWVADKMLYRASRTGDGTDATVLASGVESTQLATFGGYVWWSLCSVECVLYRVATTGGTLQIVATGRYVLAASPSALYLATNSGDQILARAANGATTVVVESLPPSDVPFYAVADGSELFWRANTGLWRVPATGGTPAAVPGVTLDDSNAFGVTADSILYNFTRNGYQTIPR